MTCSLWVIDRVRKHPNKSEVYSQQAQRPLLGASCGSEVARDPKGTFLGAKLRNLAANFCLLIAPKRRSLVQQLLISLPKYPDGCG